MTPLTLSANPYSTDNYCVVPIDDLYPHDEYSEQCHCKPRVEEYGNGAKLYIHNSFDKREIDEFWREKISDKQ